MRNIILADSQAVHQSLYPLTFTRPTSQLIVGILSIQAKWQQRIEGSYSYLTADFLSELYPCRAEGDDNLFIASHLLPDDALTAAVEALRPGEALRLNDGTIAAWCGAADCRAEDCNYVDYDKAVDLIEHSYDIFSLNDRGIQSDFALLTRGRVSQPLSPTCTVVGDRSLVFICEGATVECSSFNTTRGPIYIGVGAEVMEGSCLRGPIAVGDHATVNMATKIYGATTIGAHCKVGGELNNVVMLPYSNKAHDGFLGNAVIGSWCNLGAGCVASNLKNDYTEIKLWHYPSRRFVRTGLQFCGLIMGDHSKAGINTMFNTATTVGVGVNIHGTGFPRNFVASFSDGSAVSGFTDVALSKFFAIAERVMARRGVELSDAERRLFTYLHELTESYK